MSYGTGTSGMITFASKKNNYRQVIDEDKPRLVSQALSIRNAEAR